MLTSIKHLFQKGVFKGTDKNSVKAYEIWSENYDRQPGNLMLDLDERIFGGLIENIELKNKKVADIGCGTGRHWEKLYKKQPSLVMGFDVSAAMLKQLLRKFPSALTQQTTDNLLKQVPDEFVDCLITTLTIAHIENIDEAISSWSRVVKRDGDLVVTDFHPVMLASGGKRSFRHRGKTLTIINHIHPLEELKSIFAKYGFTVISLKERKVDEEVKNYYANQHALAVYEQFKGIPVIYGIHLKKYRATE